MRQVPYLAHRFGDRRAYSTNKEPREGRCHNQQRHAGKRTVKRVRTVLFSCMSECSDGFRVARVAALTLTYSRSPDARLRTPTSVSGTLSLRRLVTLPARASRQRQRQTRRLYSSHMLERTQQLCGSLLKNSARLESRFFWILNSYGRASALRTQFLITCARLMPWYFLYRHQACYRNG